MILNRQLKVFLDTHMCITFRILWLFPPLMSYSDTTMICSSSSHVEKQFTENYGIIVHNDYYSKYQ